MRSYYQILDIEEKNNESLLKNLEKLKLENDNKPLLKKLEKLRLYENEEMKNLTQKMDEEIKKLKQKIKGQPLQKTVIDLVINAILSVDKKYTTYKEKEQFNREINNAIDALEKLEQAKAEKPVQKVPESIPLVLNRCLNNINNTLFPSPTAKKEPLHSALDTYRYSELERKSRDQDIINWITNQDHEIRNVISSHNNIKTENTAIGLFSILENASRKISLYDSVFIQAMGILLKEHSAFLNMRLNEHNHTLIMTASAMGASWLSISGNYGNAFIIRALLEGGADPNLVDKVGISPLLRYIYGGHYAGATALIQGGADVEAKDGEKGLTPLMLLAQDNSHCFNNTECYKQRDISRSSQYYTIYGIEPLESLIQAKAKIDAVDSENRTAIDHSANFGKWRVQDASKPSLGNLVLIHRLLIEGATHYNSKKLLDFLSIYSSSHYSDKFYLALFSHAITQCIVITYEKEITAMMTRKKAASLKMHSTELKQEKAETMFSQLPFKHEKAEAEFYRLQPEARKQVFKALEITGIGAVMFSRLKPEAKKQALKALETTGIYAVSDDDKKIPLIELIYEYSQSPIELGLKLRFISSLSKKPTTSNNSQATLPDNQDLSYGILA